MSTQLTTEIKEDIKARFNNYQEPEQVKVRGNARALVAYVNETTDGQQYWVGIVKLKGENTRVLVTNGEAFKF